MNYKDAVVRLISKEAARITDFNISCDYTSSGIELSFAVFIPYTAAAQYEADQFMLEFHPDRMTPAQLANWGDSQHPIETTMPTDLTVQVVPDEPSVDELKEIYQLAVKYRNESRAAEELLKGYIANDSASEADWDELDVDVHLALNRLFSAIDDLQRDRSGNVG